MAKANVFIEQPVMWVLIIAAAIFIIIGLLKFFAPNVIERLMNAISNAMFGG